MKAFFLMGGIVALGVIVFSVFTTDIPLLGQVISSTSPERVCIQELLTAYPTAKKKEFEAQRADLNGDSTKDVIVRINSDSTCGSAGCLYELCLIETVGEATHISFGFAAHTIEPLETVTNGMRDLEINNDKMMRLQWNSVQYELKQ